MYHVVYVSGYNTGAKFQLLEITLITNYLITVREGFTVKFQTEGWNFCFMDHASVRGP